MGRLSESGRVGSRDLGWLMVEYFECISENGGTFIREFHNFHNFHNYSNM